MNLFASLESAFDREIGSIKPADPYYVHREFDPKPGNPDGIEFVRQPEVEVARYRDSIKRHVAKLNADDTVQAMADALAREVQS